MEKIKRTSSRIRNPLNEADEFERHALAYYATLNENSPLISDTYIQKLTDQRGTYYRYYKALQIKPLCTTCHGPAQGITGEVAQQLKLYYPEDRAMGYTLDDLRGVVSITIR